MATSKRDRLFAEPIEDLPSFAFNKAVAEVFQDMIKRSVPGYQTIVSYTGELAERFVQSNTNCYDLGCSLGASTMSIRQRIAGRKATIFAVDNSSAMLEKCTVMLANQHSDINVRLINADICDIDINNASLAVMNFTLQFIPIEKRGALLNRIHRGLNSNGCLIISEKLHFESPPLNHLLDELHQQFKRSQGYSDLEISQKRDAIENVLVPETLECHIKRLKTCGFTSISPWFQCFNFCSLIAIK
ncbi:MAG: carboxy-S-adenosyl-L-methionine synthase CmoA [Porticoccaceae bacterium]